MNMKKIIIMIEKQWTSKNIVNGVTPAEKLAKQLVAMLPVGTTVNEEGFTCVTILVDADVLSTENVVKMVSKAFFELYAGAERSVLSISVEGGEEASDGELLTPSSASVGAQTDTQIKDEALIPPSSNSGNAQGLNNGVEDLLGEGEAESTTETSAIEEIEGLIAADDLKSLAHEIVALAPMIIKNKTYDVFTNQSYIFSINDGYGISTYTTLLAQLIGQSNLKKISTRLPSVEIKLGAMDDRDPFASHGAFASLLSFLSEGRISDCVLCIDISEWMSALEGEHFRKLLKLLDRYLDRYVYIFRIPYVESDVLERVQLALNDLMFVQALTFPPLSREELQVAAEREIKQYGFEIEENAWESFHNRIAEEKRDGKFYGFNTVKKIVRELVYKKYRSNVKANEENTVICSEDTARLSIMKPVEGVDGFEQLSKLVGGEAIRKQVEEILLQIKFARSGKSSAVKSPCIHMRFVGNPGTGKTTVARIVGKILKDNNVLRIGGFYEYAGRDFCGRYIGETAPKTASICRDAYGSVLFIDEAYTLYRDNTDGKDYGREALDTLIAEMENHRDDFVVIMAGYTDDMDKLMEGNAGLVGRMPYVIEFPNFTREQLFDIFVSMLEGCQYSEDLLPVVKEYFTAIAEEVIKSKAFSNARFVRNLYERMWAKALRRCQLEKTEELVLCAQDFEQASSEKGFKAMMEKKKTSRLGFYE